MSEFTVGNLFRKKDADALKTALEKIQNRYLIKDLNEKWGALLLKGEWYMEVRDDLLAISQALPIMHFEHAEDHGWEYVLLKDGAVLALLQVDYEMEYLIKRERLEALYPDEDVHTLSLDIWEKIGEDIVCSESYRAQMQNRFRHADVEQFQVFDLPQEKMEELRKLLNVDSFMDPEQRFEQIERFKTILGIEEMSWTRYELEMEHNN